MNDYEKKIQILDIQMIGSLLFIGSLVISIILTYNQKQYTLNKKPLFSYDETYIISNLNRIFVLGIVFAFLYSSYQLREISKHKGNDLKLNNLDVSAAVLNTVSAIILLYITYNATPDNVLNIENPNI